jgi:hypothetical protein
LRRAIPGVWVFWMPATIERVDRTSSCGKPTKKVSGAGSIDIRCALWEKFKNLSILYILYRTCIGCNVCAEMNGVDWVGQRAKNDRIKMTLIIFCATL